MKNLKKDLQAVNKELNALSKKVEKLIAAVGKHEKSKATKAKPPKKPVTKTGKKTTPKTAPETIMDVILNSEGDVGIKTLKEKTGFQGQKLYSTLSILKKRGKVKNPRKGDLCEGVTLSDSDTIKVSMPKIKMEVL